MTYRLGMPGMLPALISAVLLVTPLGGEWAVFENAHIQANYDSQTDTWELGINPGHGGTDLVPAGNAILLLDANTRLTVPSLDPAWDFMGEEGDDVWATPAIGFAQYGVPADVFTGGENGMIAQTLVDYGGPDTFFMYRPDDA